MGRILLILSVVSFSALAQEKTRSYFYGGILGKKPILGTIGVSIMPTSRVRLEVFPTHWLSIDGYYISSRLMGVYPSDLYEKINAGFKLHPFLYTIRKEKNGRIRFLTLNAFIGPEFTYRIRNSFRVLDNDGFLLKDQQLVFSKAQGTVVNSGVRVLYGGKSLGVELSLSLVVGYLYYEIFEFSSESAGTVELYKYIGYNKFIGVGEFFVSLIYVVGKNVPEEDFNKF